MDVQFLALLLVLVLLITAMGFWAASWVLWDRPLSLIAFYYAGVFGFGALLSLLLWRITSP